MADRRVTGLLMGAGAAAFGYAVAIEPSWIKIENYSLFSPRLPREFDGFRIYQLSDLHLQKFGKREQIIAGILNNLPPADIAVITGDMIHTRKGTEPLLKLTESIKANQGIYAIFGNSEYKNGVRPMEFARRLEQAGITPLLNSHITLQRNNESIVLAGVEDPWTDLDDLGKALEGVPEHAYKLLLMHSPDSIAEAVTRGVDIVLSGHTHGGQIRLPFLGPLYTHSHMGLRMSSGYYSGNRLRKAIGIRPGYTQLYITRGLGISGLAMRFLCRPEFTVLTLRRGIPGLLPSETPITSW